VWRFLIEAAPATQRRGSTMAAQGETDKELIVHRRGYQRFISVFRIAAAICLVIAFIVILIIRK
jgi:hypothetical protein